MKKAVLLVVLLWITCGYLARGMALGHFQHKYPDQSSAAFVNSFCLGGPMALVVALVEEDRPYQYTQHTRTTQERWEAFQERFPGLDLAYFIANRNNGESFTPLQKETH